MNINFNAIKEAIYVNCQLAAEQIGYLKNYIVRQVKLVSPYLQQPHWGALTVVAGNILLIELVALRVSDLVAFLIDKLTTPFYELPENERSGNWRIFVLSGTFLSIMAAGNYGFYQALSLNPLTFTAISVTTCGMYLFLRSRNT